MKLQWTELAAVTVLVGAGCAAIYAGLARAMRRAMRERQRQMERRLDAMATTVKALQARIVELDRLQAARAPEITVTPISKLAEKESGRKKEGVKPEIVVALTAAATAFLGKKARIRSAHLLPSEPDSAGAWAQQGRVIVQTSHNLRPRG